MRPTRFWSPFTSRRQFFRVMIKAVLLLFICDALQIAVGFAPALDHWSIYKYFTPPTARIGIADQIGDPIWWRLDVLLDAHEIAQPKAPDEYRVVFLGDSATFCLYCVASEAIPQAFTDLGATIGNKHIRAYNLAYPGSDWLKDILILKHALDYQPDAVIWLITAKGSNDQPDPRDPQAHLIVRINADGLPGLAKDYGFDTWEVDQYADAAAWYQSSIWFHGGRFRDWLVLIARTVWSPLIRSGDITKQYLLPGDPVNQLPIQATAEINSSLPGYQTFPNRQWDLLLAAQQMAQARGIPLLIVNEPTYIGSGPNADVNYNSFYERALYDRFRAAMTMFVQQHGLAYLDLWNSLPPEDFSNTSLHYNLAGNQRVAQELMQQFQTLAAPLMKAP
jgi:hypothetical protein